MIGDKAFQVHDGHGLIELTPATFHLTGMSADTTTDTGEGIGPFQDFIGIVDPSSPDQSHIGRDVHAHRTGMLTGALKESRADRCRTMFIADMGLIFVPEVTNGT